MRGDWRRQGAVVSAAFPRIANPTDMQVHEDDPGRRRLKLARWLVDPTHPLTARTIVNRIWMHHFGQGLSIDTQRFRRDGTGTVAPGTARLPGVSIDLTQLGA